MFFTGHIAHKCRNAYPAVPCTKDDYQDWFQMDEGRCVKAFGRERVNFDDAEVIKTSAPVRLHTVNMT